MVSALDSSLPDGAVVRRVLELFLDHPECPFSVHAITSLGARYGVRPGDWFAPTPLCRVLRDICMRCQPAGLRAYCARDGAVYRDELVAMHQQAPVAHGTSSAEEACLAAARAVAQTASAAAAAQGAFAVLVPVRLGVGATVHAPYAAMLAALFRVPQFIGIVGGRPHSSLFFFAAQGDNLYYLNPHYVQQAVPHPQDPSDIDITVCVSLHLVHFHILLFTFVLFFLK